MNAAIAPAPRPMPSAARFSEQKLAEQRAHEPSMEEILASIRRIIADDSTLPVVPRPVTEAANPSITVEAAPEVPLPAALVVVADATPLDPRAPHIDMDAITAALESSIFMAVEPVAPAPVRLLEATVAPDLAMIADEKSGEPKVAAVPWQPAMVAQPAPAIKAAAPASAVPSEPDVLVSAHTDAAVSSSFQALATTMFVNDSDMIENLTREMLRPMLKTWLDDNLPMMVERLVRVEIERVARGGR